MTYKYDCLKFLGLQKFKNFNNLILGSSHGRDGFVPAKNDYNLSNSSLDLYRFWYLYKYISEHDYINLNNIIIFWSVFHAGLQLEKTREFKKCIPYKVLYDINYAFPLPTDDKLITKQIKEQLSKTICPEDFRGKSEYNIRHNESAESLAYKHIKNTQRNNNQIQYLNNIVELARKQNHKIYIVLPPYRYDYLKHLPEEEIIYRELFDFLNKNKDVKLLNFQHDKDFEYSDFDSPDHCNEKGGIKLTKKIKIEL